MASTDLYSQVLLACSKDVVGIERTLAELRASGGRLDGFYASLDFMKIRERILGKSGSSVEMCLSSLAQHASPILEARTPKIAL